MLRIYSSLLTFRRAVPCIEFIDVPTVDIAFKFLNRYRGVGKFAKHNSDLGATTFFRKRGALGVWCVDEQICEQFNTMERT